MKLLFLTFGGLMNDYHEAVKRLCMHAEKMFVFDEIIGLTENDLMNDPDFWPKHQAFINSNPRGYGYWLWKPYIIKKTLEKMNDDDILLYLDSGCELNYRAKNKFMEYVELTKTKKIIGTSAGSNDCNYTKMDLIKYLNMQNDVSLLQLPHMQACALLILKCKETVDLCNEYYDIGSNNYHFIDDTPSIEPNFSIFREHRHDQSIFSLLVKKHKLINYDLNPTDWGYGVTAKEKYNKYGSQYPIWTCRNRTGVSMLK